LRVGGRRDFAAFLSTHASARIVNGQRGKVLDLLRSAGRQGVMTSEFLAIGVGRFSARIEELRNLGYEISAERMGRSSWRYRLERDLDREAALARQRRAAEDEDGTPLLFDPGETEAA
jgi:hypothetical protein